MVIRSGDWKLITALGSGGFSDPRKVKPEKGGPRGQLYNLKDDPQEKNNLYLKESERVDQLEALLKTITEKAS